MADPTATGFAGKRVVFSARRENLINRTIEQARLLQRTGVEAATREPNPSVVLVRNRSSAEMPRFGVAVLGGQNPVVLPSDHLAEFQREVIIEGVTPTASGQAFAIALEVAPTNSFFHAAIAGAVCVQINVTDDTHRLATTLAGDTSRLQSSATCGVCILWKESGTGLKWAIVKLENICCGRTSQDAIRVVTAAGAVTIDAATDYTVVVNKTVGAATVVNLPASPTAGWVFRIKDGKGDAATNNLTLTPASGTIDGASTFVMDSPYQAVDVVHNGSQWNIL